MSSGRSSMSRLELQAVFSVVESSPSGLVYVQNNRTTVSDTIAFVF